MKNYLVGGLLSLTCLSATAQKKIDFIEYDLPNGLHVILHEEHATPIVAVTVLYHVGSKNERVGRTGFAHFFEHLLFEGSNNIGRGEYSEIVEKNGGELNANTSQDRTFYYEVLPSNQLELGLWLESERMLHAKVDNVGVETQRSVVKEEKRQRYDNQPYATFIGEMFKRMFTKHPYNWIPIGSMEDLNAAQEEDYVNFYKTFYVPSNATLSIAGDINVAQAKKWIDTYFGSIPKGEGINLYRDVENLSDEAFKQKYGVDRKKFDLANIMGSKDIEAKRLINAYTAKPVKINRPEKDTELLTGVLRDTVYDNIQLPAIFVGYKFPAQTHEDTYALTLLNDILSSGSSSRMNKSIVEKQQLANFAFSYNYALEDAGMGIFAAFASKDVKLESIEAEFDKLISEIKTNLVSQEEFEKVRNALENNLVYSNASVAGVAENLADNHVYFGGANEANKSIDRYLKVTREDIMRVANKYLTQDARIILYYLPNQTN